jgi:hypothetical protein
MEDMIVCFPLFVLCCSQYVIDALFIRNLFLPHQAQHWLSFHVSATIARGGEFGGNVRLFPRRQSAISRRASPVGVVREQHYFEVFSAPWQ